MTWVNTIERILGRHVQKTDTCWIWKASVRNGYAVVGFQGKVYQAHRLIYEALKGPIPAGLHLDHLCRNPACVNPDHLEPVTPLENVLRGLKGRLKTHCKRGHPFDGDNLYYHPRGARMCRICRQEVKRRWDDRRKVPT